MTISETQDESPEATVEPFLMTGEQYRQSLRDGRRIIAPSGEEIADVTEYPSLARGVDTIAGLYDAQFDPATQDITTYFDPDRGKRVSLGWKVPETREDLRRWRQLIRLSTYHTLGVFGRPPDYGSVVAMGFLSVRDKIEKVNPEMIENVERFLIHCRERNLTSAALIADVQSDKTIPLAEKPGRLRCVEERADGLVLYGAKPCASVAAQGHVATIASLLLPGADPAAAIFCAVPINAEGLTLVLREPVTDESDPQDHPLNSRGEESDTMMLFDRVFVPRERVFSFQNEEVLGLYREACALCHWHILSRLWYRAEIFAGIAQVIAEVLGTDSIPQVRDAIARVTAYAATLKAFIVAAEDEAEMWNGVCIPSDPLVTAGRLHSLEHYPEVMTILRDLSGQGMISRFTKAQFDHPDIGAKLEEFLPGTGVSARAKNRLFNLVWDLTCSSHAMRVALFENVNALPPSAIRAEIYQSHDRSEWAGFVRRYAGIE
jgi:4-hydroxyphenylacetate 3-monooxygenase